MLIYAVVSWLPGLRGRWTDYLAMVIEPVLIPIRRYIPPVYGLDLSFMIVLLVLRFLSRAIIPHECYYGSGMYI
jgi:YggT family protein